MSKLKMKKVAVAVACLLLLIPATVAQSPQMHAKAICVQGELKGVVLQIQKPGNYTIMFSEDICDSPRRDGVTT